MRIAALDISKNRVGIAISDEDRLFISYENTLKTKNKKFFKQQLEEIYKNYIPVITYIGLPVFLHNSKSETYNFVKSFSHEIRFIIGKFEFIDESFSTIYVENLIENNFIHNFHSVDSAVAKNIIINKLKSFASENNVTTKN
jgi:RNase H-fold protein (predicted Holliday junction resolvase)